MRDVYIHAASYLLLVGLAATALLALALVAADAAMWGDV